MIDVLTVRSIAAAALIAASAWGGYSWRDRSAAADLAECRHANAQTFLTLSRAAHEAEASYRAREAQTNKLQTEAVDAALQNARQAHADADRLRVVIDRLRRDHAAAPSGGEPAAHPTLAGASTPALTTRSLPADLFWRGAEMAGELAAYADHARIAGAACERAYDALMPAQSANPTPQTP